MSEPTPLDLPVGLRWVKLVCRLGRLVTDSAADVDAHPDLLPVGGTLTLTASPSRVRVLEADGRWRSVEVAGRTYTIRADGELVDNEGRVGVYIPDPASLLVEPQGYAITAAVKPTAGTEWRVTVGGSTVLPDVVDLVAVSSVGSVSPSVTSSFDARLYALETGGGVDVGQAVEDYLTANPPAAGLDTEAAQDVVGAMIVAAGGTYDDSAGTITLPAGDVSQAVEDYLVANPPAGSGSTGVTAGDTPAAPAEGQSASYLVTSAVTWPAGLVWSTDPDGGTAPTITGTALVSLFTVGGTTRAIMGATFSGGSEPDPDPDPDPTDTTAPSWTATLTTGTPGSTSVTVTATALATDNVMVTGYEASVNSGATWQPITPVGAVFTLTGLTEDTSYPAPQLRAKDAAGNTSAPLTAQAFATAAAAASLSEAILAASPAGYWKLDETTGTTFADSSGNSRNATAGGASPQLAVMPGPGATSHVNFQSGASALTVADDDAFSIASTGLTLMFLSRSANGTETNARAVLTKQAEWTVRINHNAPGTVQSFIYSPSSQIQQSENAESNLPANVWSLHFIKYTDAVSGNRHQQYINGVLQSSTQGALGTPHAYANGTYPVQIGSSDVRGIAHAAIFPAALTPAQISYIADAARAEGWIS